MSPIPKHLRSAEELSAIEAWEHADARKALRGRMDRMVAALAGGEYANPEMCISSSKDLADTAYSLCQAIDAKVKEVYP